MLKKQMLPSVRWFTAVLYVITIMAVVLIVHDMRVVGATIRYEPQSLTRVEDLHATGFLTSDGTTTLGDAAHDTTVGRNLSVLAGDTSLGGTGQTKIIGGKGIQINSVSGVLTIPRVLSFNGNPNTIVTAAVGSLLMDTLTPAIWINTDGATAWTVLATGSTVTSSVTTAINAINYGWFGTGNDGSPSFDGVTTVLGLVPVANTYTLVRDVTLDSPSCSSGVTIKPAGWRIFVKTDFIGPGSGTCTIDDHGQDAVGVTPGSGLRVNNFLLGGPLLLGGNSGGVGINSGSTSGGGGCTTTISSACTPRLAGNGGAGGGDPGVANGGVACITTCAQIQVGGGTLDYIQTAIQGWMWGGSTPRMIQGGSGGAGGGNAGIGAGNSGAGGAGGGYQVFVAHHVTNAGNVLLNSRGGNGTAAGSLVPCSGGAQAGGGAGAGGGYVILVIGNGTQPTFNINGGTGGAGCGTLGTAGGNGTNGQFTPFVTGS